MEHDAPAIPRRTRALVLGVVVLGLVLLGVGVLLALNRCGSPGDAAARVKTWCELRREWARRVDALAGDILVQAAQENRDGLAVLLEERAALGNAYAERLRTLVESDAALWNLVQDVEIALLKEGKVRSNLAVEIHNATTNLALDDPAVLRRDEAVLAEHLAQRSNAQKAAIDADLARASAPLGCTGIYRGPLSVGDLAEDPYLSWEELELRRVQALRRVRSRLIALEPLEQYAREVQEVLLQRYRGPLKVCHQRTQAKNPDIADTLGLRVRVRQDGRVQTLGLEWMAVRDEAMLDCLLQQAGKWQLPRPPHDGAAVVVTVDAARL